MAIGAFVEKAKGIATDTLSGLQTKDPDQPGNAQDAADKEVNGAKQGTDHRAKSAGDAADNAADSPSNQEN